ncbi:hypothetical protein V2J09_010411 [Rumex salicifolius]
MDDDQGMERFGMENDFDDGQWIGGEFYYRKRKEKPVQTKEDVLYGYLSSDDDDDDGGFSRKKKKGLKTKADFTKPVHFVSTGTVLPNKEIDQQAKEAKNEEDDYRPGLGLGAGSSAGFGLGFTSSSVKNREAGKDEHVAKEEDEGSFLPSEFGKIIKEGAKQRMERSMKSVKSKSDVGGSRKQSEFLGSDAGTFEKHTKGFGQKMLEKMGHKGGGLGKYGQGIVAPLEAKLRPKNMGMGFNDYQESKNLPKLQVSQQEPEEKQPLARKTEHVWKKSVRARSKKKEEYITAEELLAKKQDQDTEPVLQKVVDMRGPQIRVLTNLENLNAEEKAKESDVPMPELQHNIRLILDLAELDILDLDRKLRNEREIAFALQQEKENLQKEAASQKQQLNNMEEIGKMLDHLSEENSSGMMNLDSLAQSFGDLQRRFPADYKICNLPCIACSYALPLFIRTFQRWDLLQNPSYEKDRILLWKNLLQGDEHLDIFGDTSSPYSQLIMEVVLPAVRIFGINTWQPRDPEPMLRFLEQWEDLLPSSVRQSILDMVVMPKLSKAVDSWDPCRETIPIHAWVHPWLPLLRDKLETLYQAIRVKLGFALQAWHPSDSSAFTILNPWKTVFDPMSWENLIVRCILPKLYEVMQDFQVNPANQNLDQFKWVMTWVSAIPIHHLVNLLEHHFFSKWNQVLYHWLTSNPNFEEITQWYLGWKRLLPPELAANERIRIQLNMALDMMNQAVEGLQVAQPGLRENISYLRAREQRQFEAEKAALFAQKQTSMGNGASQMDEPEMSLMEVIAAYAKEHDLLFMPKPGRIHHNHQIHGFGTVSIIVDSLHQKIFALSGENWSLVSLEQLLQMQNLSVPRRREMFGDHEKENDLDDGRRKRKQNPVQISDDDNHEDGLSRKRKKGLKSKADSKNPVYSMSTEIAMPNQEIDRIAIEGKNEENGYKPGLKLGAGSSAGKSATFDKHTKGFGQRMLEKMGHKGGGLGKYEQGIVAPLEAKLRPKNMGLGFNDYKNTKNLPKQLVSQQESEKQPLARKKEDVWKKSVRARSKEKREYITAEELLAKKQDQDAELVPLKVVDMRGKHIRILTDLENLNAEENAKEDVPMQELLHNVRLILDLSEIDLLDLDRRLRNEREIALALQQEKEKLQEEAAWQKQQLNSMEDIVKVLEQLSKENSSGMLTLDSLAQSFEDLRRRFPDDYIISNLSWIACSYAFPLFIRTFQRWDILQDPSNVRDQMLLWKNLLQGDEHLDIFGDITPYTQLIMEVVLPAVRIFGINTWQARDPKPMIRFLEHWEDLLPSLVRQSIFDMIVMPKLSEAIDSWDPHRETISIHAWIHPWLPLLGEKLESLYQAILMKLGFALQAWHPSDGSAFTILNPWKTVFDPVCWGKLIDRCILPKLIEVMQDFEVNPANQNLDPFKWVMTWASEISIHKFVNLLEQHFFSKWNLVLYHWLTSNPNFEEITEWYLGWKSLLPPELAASERIQIHLHMALNMMNQAVEGLEVAYPIIKAPEQKQVDAQKEALFAQKQTSMGNSASQMDEPEMSLMEVIATYAIQNNLLFMPKPGRIHHNHQIHEFGTVSIIVDSLHQKIFALAGENLSLVCLEQLLQMQRQGSEEKLTSASSNMVNSPGLPRLKGPMCSPSINATSPST